MSVEEVSIYNDNIENQWRQDAFLGEVPIDTIFSGLTSQFEDYINTEDHEHYVHIFFHQLHQSYDDNVQTDDELILERKEFLDGILDKFRYFMIDLFETRLGISLDNLATKNFENDEFIFMRLYEFFILHAKDNFKTVISMNLNENLEKDLTEDQYFYQVQTLLMELYSPLITVINPIEFLRYSGDIEVLNIFESFTATGNFLQKYTPKLYENELFRIELINAITTYKLFIAEREGSL